MITEFGKELRKLRIDLDVSQSEMAKSLDLTASVLSAIEAGRRAIPLDLAEKLLTMHGHVVDRERREKAVAVSTPAITIDLTGYTTEKRELAIRFARMFPYVSVVADLVGSEDIADGDESKYATLKEGVPDKDSEDTQAGRALTQKKSAPGRDGPATLHPEDPLYERGSDDR